MDVMSEPTHPSEQPARRLLLVHAHPDDETINNGVTMAHYAEQGVGVTLVTCTLGEEGEILEPVFAQLAADQADQLGGYRIAELDRAMRALGVEDHRFLGGPGRYRDSGMMGTPANEHPRSFWQADVDEAARHLVAVIREVRPQVLVTYDENGGYGHPDHIQTHRGAMRAAELAADPTLDVEGAPWEIAKIYWATIPRSVLQRGLELMREQGSDFFGVDSVDELPFVQPDDVVTTAVRAPAWLEAKKAAMRAHATQISVDGPFFALSNNVGLEAMGTEYYRLVRGDRGPGSGEHGWEDDLFAGLGL
jgi:N-acetyl-1-D-myo-inositol-2-amino-2-deoxy-alpha-D-glucopyranoside deacetylase